MPTLRAIRTGATLRATPYASRQQRWRVYGARLDADYLFIFERHAHAAEAPKIRASPPFSESLFSCHFLMPFHA